ncbi:RNA polymerase sigma factor [Planosporangium sp. 12N6]|uniref:RNA polymerase sigma factor n=1 Tax=Planosporangium spinosum TaxID=3402278 RepID=UPI003CEC275F
MTETPVDALVSAAARGDEDAWSELVARYTPLVFSVIAGYRLGPADAADANQTVWLRLVEHLGDIHEPRTLPRWLVTTARHECLRLLRAGRRTQPFDPLATPVDGAGPAGVDGTAGVDDAGLDDHLLRVERQQVLRDAFGQLPARCRILLAMLVTDPPASYEEISERLDLPVGSIGPTRARCLEKLRTCSAVVAFRDALRAAETGGGERHDIAAVGRR